MNDTVHVTDQVDGPSTLADLPEPDESWEDEPVTGRRWLSRTGIILAGLVAVAAGFIGGIVTTQATAGSDADSDTAGAALSEGAALLPEGLAADGGGAMPGLGTGALGATSGDAVAGTVKLVDGRSLYVTDLTGETVHITVGGTTKVRYLASGHVADLKPGDAVTVDGKAAASGEVRAESIEQTSG